MEAMLVLILIMLIYIVFKSEQFKDFVSTLKSKEFNFKNNSQGYSQADVMLADRLHSF